MKITAVAAPHHPDFISGPGLTQRHDWPVIGLGVGAKGVVGSTATGCPTALRAADHCVSRSKTSSHRICDVGMPASPISEMIDLALLKAGLPQLCPCSGHRGCPPRCRASAQTPISRRPARPPRREWQSSSAAYPLDAVFVEQIKCFVEQHRLDALRTNWRCSDLTADRPYLSAARAQSRDRPSCRGSRPGNRIKRVVFWRKASAFAKPTSHRNSPIGDRSRPPAACCRGQISPVP